MVVCARSGAARAGTEGRGRCLLHDSCLRSLCVFSWLFTVSCIVCLFVKRKHTMFAELREDAGCHSNDCSLNHSMQMLRRFMYMSGLSTFALQLWTCKWNAYKTVQWKDSNTHTHVHLRPVSSKLRFLDSKFPGNSPWAWKVHPSTSRFFLRQTVWNPES